MSDAMDDGDDDFGQPESLVERVVATNLVEIYQRLKDKAQRKGIMEEANFFRPPCGIELIPVEDMWLPQWQRGLDIRHAAKLGLQWNAAHYNVATLCTLPGDEGDDMLPEGKYYLNDAQQRTAAALCREAELIEAGFFIVRDGVKILAMPAVIHCLKDADQAMNQFISINISQKRLSRVQIYMSEICAGRPAAIGLYRKLNTIGVHIVANPISQGDTNAIFVIQSAMDQNEDWILRALASIHGATEFPMPKLLVEAVYVFICNRKGKISEVTLHETIVTLLESDNGDPKRWIKQLVADLEGVQKAKLDRVVSAISAVYNMKGKKAA